jgi:hypothetical protein
VADRLHVHRHAARPAAQEDRIALARKTELLILLCRPLPPKLKRRILRVDLS